MELNSMQDLLLEQIKDVYSAEKQLVKALPKLAEAAHSNDLADAFTSHLRQTEEHVRRLEQVFELLGESPRAKTCKGMEGLIKEGDEAAGQKGDNAIVDAGIIAAAQRVEHYEIAAYGCMIRYAEQIGLQDAVALLQTTLDEEKAADDKLTEVSDMETGADTRMTHKSAAGGSGLTRKTARRKRETSFTR